MRCPRGKVKSGQSSRRRQKPTSHQRSAWPANWFMGVLLVLMFTIAAIVHVRSKLAVVGLGYELSKATSEHKRLIADYRKLQVEAATLRSPRRLRKLATQTLGLSEPAASQIVHPRAKKRRKLALGEP